MMYDPSNWYWIVDGDTSKAWSSATAGFVPVSDETYSAWLASGGGPTPIGSLAELAEVFAAQYPGGMLKTYAAAVRYAKEIAGCTVGGVTYPSDRDTQAKLTAAALFAQVDNTQTFQWKLADGSFSDELSAAQMITIAAAVGGYVNSCFAEEAAVVAEIDAGTITTRAQVDAAFAA